MKHSRNILIKLFFHLVLMMITITGILGIFFYVYLPFTTHYNQHITVPELTGKHVSTLENLLRNYKLRFAVTKDSAYAAHYSPLTVLQQYPKAGVHVKNNRKIYVTLNAVLPPNIRMPNLIDGSLRNAKVLLKSHGLRLGKIDYVPDLAKNAVLKQYYEGQPISPNTWICKGSKIDLTVGTGIAMKEIKTPLLIDHTLQAAQNILANQGLELGQVIKKAIDTLSSGIVFRQLPLQGESIALNSKVDVWIVYKPSD